MMRADSWWDVAPISSLLAASDNILAIGGMMLDIIDLEGALEQGQYELTRLKMLDVINMASKVYLADHGVVTLDESSVMELMHLASESICEEVEIVMSGVRLSPNANLSALYGSTREFIQDRLSVSLPATTERAMMRLQLQLTETAEISARLGFGCRSL